MTHIVASILISICVGLLFAIPGMILGYWLNKAGLAPNRGWFSIIFCVTLSLLHQFWLTNLSYSWLALISITGSTIGAYSMDIYWSMNQPNQGDESKN